MKTVYMLMYALEILRIVLEDYFEILRKDEEVLVPTLKHYIRIFILQIDSENLELSQEMCCSVFNHTIICFRDFSAIG